MPQVRLIRSHAISKKILRTLVLMLTIAIIAAAIWVAGKAIAENIRFARATDQMVQLVAGAHSLAVRDKNFALQSNDNAISALIRSGIVPGNAQMPPAMLINPWQEPVQANTVAPSMIRIETTLPGHDCRRMALFFIKNGAGLGLTAFETRRDAAQPWQKFYDSSQSLSIDDASTENACESLPHVNLAFMFSVR